MNPSLMPGATPQATGSALPGGSSAERSLRLLRLLARSERAVSLTELAGGLSLPKATVHRLCAQLAELGYVVRDVEERSYGIGPALHDLALDTLHHGSLRVLRHQVLSELVAQVGETCNYTALDGARVLYVDRVEAKWPLRMTLDVGSHVPLHCTASGKLFLAWMPRARRDALIDRLDLQANTPGTITGRGALRAECDAIRAAGHSCDREEFISGLIAVAVPVLDGQGRCRAAIAVHAPTVRLSLEGALSRLDALVSAAQRMAQLI